MSEAKDYGEPWDGPPSNRPSDPNERDERDELNAFTKGKDGTVWWVGQFETEDYRDRAVACVNALAGIESPEEFVKEADVLAKDEAISKLVAAKQVEPPPGMEWRLEPKDLPQ